MIDIEHISKYYVVDGRDIPAITDINLRVEQGEIFGIIGAILMVLDFSVAPIMLGFVLGPMMEENFRRALLLSRGDMMVFMQRPISATFVCISAFLLAAVTWSAWRKSRVKRLEAQVDSAGLAPVTDA